MRSLVNLRASATAIAVILAMLLVPACGSLCAAMNHCSTSATSASSDSCHHADMSAQSDSKTLSSPASCGEKAPLLAILSGSDPTIQFNAINAATAPFSSNVLIHTATPKNISAESLSSNESPQESIPLENLSVLRI
ncbi:MAG TPA: hypothetical protein VGJ06_20145 [Candidatus Acidoferrum sp.]|jgi:hypothetical protein